jgi:hypothetical protein
METSVLELDKGVEVKAFCENIIGIVHGQHSSLGSFLLLLSASAFDVSPRHQGVSR